LRFILTPIPEKIRVGARVPVTRVTYKMSKMRFRLFRRGVVNTAILKNEILTWFSIIKLFAFPITDLPFAGKTFDESNRRTTFTLFHGVPSPSVYDLHFSFSPVQVAHSEVLRLFRLF
jgi:hypothetical protein